MLLLVLILVLIAFGLLVVALLSGSVLWAWGSVGVSVAAAAVLLVDWLQRRNAVKVLVFFDIGGSMDSHIEQVEELFSAAKSEFKHMEYFYFHNCLYEGVWKQNKRRFTDRTPTWDVLHKYPHDYKVVFVGDASMSPYEIMVPGGSVEHVNEEAGSVWLDRITRTYPHSVWLNPVAQKHWDYSESTTIIRRLFSERMYPITIEGLEGAMKELVR